MPDRLTPRLPLHLASSALARLRAADREPYTAERIARAAHAWDRLRSELAARRATGVA
jgi:hypothetical protein